MAFELALGITPPQEKWLWIGVDPGLKGALGFIPAAGEPWAEKLPFRKVHDKQVVDVSAVRDRLLQLREQGHKIIAAFERPFLKRKQAGHLTIGINYGLALGGFHAAGVTPKEYEQPQDWQDIVLAGIIGDDPKLRAKEFVQKNFPTANLRASKKAGGDHEGFIDALCVAECIRRESGGA